MTDEMEGGKGENDALHSRTVGNEICFRRNMLAVRILAAVDGKYVLCVPRR